MSSDKQTLFTDFSLQMYTSFLADDYEATALLVESFRSEGKDADYLFLPGLIFGMMFHMRMYSSFICSVLESEISMEELFSKYAFHYADMRDELLNNPFLNIGMVREGIEQMEKDIERFSLDIDDPDAFRD